MTAAPRSATKVAKPRPVRGRRSDGELTRRRVLEAAIECILENGYYKTSSNQIARIAGVTWGALQHQFGSRETLLFEVLKDRWKRQEDLVATAQISGETLEARLEALMEVLSERYGRDEELAHIQILLDLTHNPEVSASTRRAVARHQQKLVGLWRPLFEQALRDAAQDHLIHYAYNAIRGYLLGSVISTNVAHPRNDRIARQLLIEGIASAIRSHAPEVDL
jgi:AcrR family transcriptional regulator